VGTVLFSFHACVLCSTTEANLRRSISVLTTTCIAFYSHDPSLGTRQLKTLIIPSVQFGANCRVNDDERNQKINTLHHSVSSAQSLCIRYVNSTYLFSSMLKESKQSMTIHRDSIIRCPSANRNKIYDSFFYFFCYFLVVVFK